MSLPQTTGPLIGNPSVEWNLQWFQEASPNPTPNFWWELHPWGQNVFLALSQWRTHIYTPTFNLGQSLLQQKHKHMYKCCFVLICNWFIVSIFSAPRIELNSYVGLKDFYKNSLSERQLCCPTTKVQDSLASPGHSASNLCVPEEGLCRVCTIDP